MNCAPGNLKPTLSPWSLGTQVALPALSPRVANRSTPRPLEAGHQSVTQKTLTRQKAELRARPTTSNSPAPSLRDARHRAPYTPAQCDRSGSRKKPSTRAPSLSTPQEASPSQGKVEQRRSEQQSTRKRNLRHPHMLTDGLDLFEFSLGGELPDDADALNALGERLERGEGCFEDLKRARECYQRAAATGHSGALFNLGQLAFFGWGGESNLRLALRCFQRASESGSPRAALQLAEFYEEGRFVKRSPKRALELYRRAAAGGLWGAIDATARLEEQLGRSA